MVPNRRPEIVLFPFDTEGRWYAAPWWLAFQPTDVEVVLQATTNVIGSLRDTTQAIAW